MLRKALRFGKNCEKLQYVEGPSWLGKGTVLVEKMEEGIWGDEGISVIHVSKNGAIVWANKKFHQCKST